MSSFLSFTSYYSIPTNWYTFTHISRIRNLFPYAPVQRPCTTSLPIIISDEKQNRSSSVWHKEQLDFKNPTYVCMHAYLRVYDIHHDCKHVWMCLYNECTVASCDTYMCPYTYHYTKVEFNISWRLINDKLRITLTLLKSSHHEKKDLIFKKSYDAIISQSRTRLGNIIFVKIFWTRFTYSIPYKSHISVLD